MNNGNNKNNGNNSYKKNTIKRKVSSNKLRIILITALIFFILGFGISYLYNSGQLKNNNSENNANQNQNTNLEDNDKNGTKDQNDITDAGNNNDKQETKTDDNKDITDKDKAAEGDNESPKENDKTPSNPQKPNVEKLDIEALEKLDNKKYSWWIKLNTEHKTPEITETIKNMIDKHDGIYIGDTSKKSIYLTFDEGYENGYTSRILDVLKDNDVKTIFFVTSSYIEKNSELVKRMLDEGHQVGNHTVSHPSLPGLSYEKLEDELLNLDKQFFEKFDTSFKYMRPPAGEYSERTLAASKQLGYKTIFWSFAYDDWYTDKIRGADYAYNKVMDNLHNGAVYLLHAVSKDNTEALDRIIKDIKAQGYEIKPFDL